MSSLTIILDPAHGADVKGKCSPDKRHYEYLWSRERVASLRRRLSDKGYNVYVTTESANEPGLTKRKTFAVHLKKDKKLLLSLHNNAAGNGSSWKTARGVEVYTTPGVTKSDICADFILQQFKRDFPGLKLRYNKDIAFERDKEANFTVISGNGYMGVLIEWLFQDNYEDVELLCNSEVNTRFECSIVKAIDNINDYFGG